MIDLPGTPYYYVNEEGAKALQDTIHQLTDRVTLLRAQGKLAEATLKEYYSEKRFEQIAESNALEGSTLSVGETELAVLKGITISGHDPGYSQDAQTLAKALEALTVMAKLKEATDIQQVKALHELILGGRRGAGELRTSEVRIRGSAHVPPRTWEDVMTQMEQWEDWSRKNATVPVLLRASVLHAWLEHIHPFVDGNGRTGRAITNLELVRAGYPPIIFRKKYRDPYLAALSRADEGDIGPFIDIVAGRTEDALRDLERAAQRKQGYDLQREKLLRMQSGRLALWNAGVHLLATSIRTHLNERLSDLRAKVEVREYDQLEVEDFIELCESRTVRLSWAFTISCKLPGGPLVERLAWAGTMGPVLRSRLEKQGERPVLMWSLPNPDKYPQWILAREASPVGEQFTLHRDSWLVTRGSTVNEYSPSELAAKVASEIADACLPSPIL